MQEKLWYTPLVWPVPVDQAVALTSDFGQGDEIRNAQPFTVSLVSAYVAADQLKARSAFSKLVQRSHDILIYSSTTRGGRAPVQRVHCHQPDADLDQDHYFSDMLSNTVHICEDYNGTDDLYISLHVTTPSTLRMKSDADFAQLGQVAGSAGGFPALAPYMPEVKVAINVIEGFTSLVTAHLDDSAEKIQDSMRLEPPGKAATKTLRYGHYVAFSDAIDGTQFQLFVNGRVDGPDIKRLSYAVFRIDQSNAPTPDFVLSQSAATLLSGLNKKEAGDAGGSPAIDFLKQTVQGYSNFQDLQRYQELKKKDSPTDAEKALMAKLEGKPELQPFLH